MARGLRFGICTHQDMSWDLTLERWRLFEDLGFDSLWDCDHYARPSRPTGPYLEAWTLLAALAARTHRARIGVLVSCSTFRHPAFVAKMAGTIDHVSGGRVELGLGAGWFEPEHAMLGIQFPSPPELVARFHEAVTIVDSLLRNEQTTFRGRYYQVVEAPFHPRPIQQPRPPLTLGAHGPKMMEIVAQYADTWSSFGTVQEMRERNQILDEKCAEIGRDPAEIGRSLYGWAALMPSDPWSSPDAFAEMVGRYGEVGMEEFILDRPRDDQLGMAERIATDLLPGLRAAAR